MLAETGRLHSQTSQDPSEIFRKKHNTRFLWPRDGSRYRADSLVKLQFNLYWRCHLEKICISDIHWNSEKPPAFYLRRVNDIPVNDVAVYCAQYAQEHVDALGAEAKRGDEVVEERRPPVRIVAEARADKQLSDFVQDETLFTSIWPILKQKM